MKNNLMMSDMTSSATPPQKYASNLSSSFIHSPNIITNTSCFGPTLTMCDDTIVHYDTHTPIYSLWSLFATSHTMIQSRRTWTQMVYMVSLSILSFSIVHVAGMGSSIRLTDIATEVRVLVSFVLGSYIAQCLGKWKNVVTHVETVSVELLKIMRVVDNAQAEILDKAVRNKALQHCRLLLMLLFYTGSSKIDLSDLVAKGVLTEQEHSLLLKVPLQYRGDMVCGWLHKLLSKNQLQEEYTDFVNNVRSCSRLLADEPHKQLPFIYTHCVNWGMQFLFLALACQVGIQIAIYIDTKSTGNGTFDDDEKPENPNLWLYNSSMGMIIAKIIFILFANGLLHVCERIQNPLNSRKASLSIVLHDNIFTSSCNAYNAGVNEE